MEQLLLDAAEEGDAAQAFTLLERSQVRRVPASVCLAELKPPSLLNRWGMSCLDVCSVPGTWASHDMCERCAAINQILRGESTVVLRIQQLVLTRAVLAQLDETTRESAP